MYKNDLRDGKGQMSWVDGSSYKGAWERGIQHGYGEMRDKEGNRKKGFFFDNIYIGDEKNIFDKKGQAKEETTKKVRA